MKSSQGWLFFSRDRFLLGVQELSLLILSTASVDYFFLAMKKSNESQRRSLFNKPHKLPRCFLNPCKKPFALANRKKYGVAIPYPCGGPSRTAEQALALWPKSLAFLQRQSMALTVTDKPCFVWEIGHQQAHY